MASNDISKTTVMILLILTIVLSALGTVTVFQMSTSGNHANYANTAPGGQGTTAQQQAGGQGKLIPLKNEKSSAGATVSFVVLPPIRHP